MIKKRSILFNGIVAVGVAFLCLSLHKYIVPQRKSVLLEQFLDSVGLTIMLLGLYLRISARGYKLEKHLDTGGLIKDGPYSLTRNPMYLGSFLVGFGVIIMLFIWWMLLVYMVFFLVWYWPQVYYEQKWLVRKYGQAYLDYCTSTSCFFPRFKTLVSFNARKHMPLKIKWIKREWNTLLVFSLIALIAEGYQDYNFYGFADFAREGLFFLLIIFYFVLFGVLFRTDKGE
ncbi:MAG: isoprenylcysteine carboxylmethyltransferase family protein [Planctomycetota bacterium]